MEDIYAWMTENAHWLWWSVGVVLLAGEMLIPGVYLLWIGAAGIVTGIFAWLFPSWGFEGHGLIFAIFGAASIYLGHRQYQKLAGQDEDPEVNRRGQRHVGKTYLVVEDIVNGRGHIAVGDSRWLAEGPDLPKGSRVRVKSVDGIVMMVEAATD